MSRITYLMGAGASAQVLPTISGLSESIRNLSAQLDRDEISWSQTPRPSDLQILQNFKDDIRAILSASKKYASIDTYARQCYLRGERSQLERIKKFLAAFFMLVQEGKLDQRYDSFYAAMMTGKMGDPSLPRHCNVLTWNYDYQNERSIAGFIPTNNKLFETLQVSPQPFWKDHPTPGGIDLDRFSVIHLNGLAGLEDHQTNSDIFLEPIIRQANKVTLTEAMKVYWNSSDQGNLTSMIRFAWEGDWPALQAAMNVMTQTEVLVIIGYSFPAFNREIDGQLLRNASLKKVYVQSEEKTIAGIVNRVRALAASDVAIEPITAIDQFHIPYEYA